MSAHSLAGLLALNALYLASGLVILWLVRGLATWGDVLRLAGLGLLVGVATIGSIWSLLLIVDVPFGLWAVLAVPVVVIVAVLVAGRSRSRPAWTGVRLERSAYVAAAGIAATGVLLESFFRVARLSGLSWWDAWAFWVPKAKVVYFYDRLDVGFFSSLPGPGYPPLVPVLDAAAFHAMGSPDVVTLHVQFWLFGVGFVWALAGVLSERVPHWILWPFVLLVLVAPRLGRRFYIAEADLFLDILFVLAAVLVGYWLIDRQRWRLVVAALLLSAAVLTKREGMLLAALLVLAALAASVREWRWTYPRLGLLALVVVLAAAPWRIWYLAHGIPGEGPSGGFLSSDNLDRLGPSLRLAFDVLFSSSYWNVIVPVALGTLVVALLAREFRQVAFFGGLVLLVALGGGWITWAIPDLPITAELGGNPIVRYMGAATLLAVAAAPVLLAAAWSSSSREPGS